MIDTIGGVHVESRNPSFAELGVAAEIVDALNEGGIERTFAIQKLALPLALDGKDIIGQARTGMGKTLAYGVPLLDRVFDSADVTAPDGTPRALVVAPTRELARQVGTDLENAARGLPLEVLCIYGGQDFAPQLEGLKKGVDVVVGTPGRLLDLNRRGALDLGGVEIVVLDEADEMLDLGFLPDVTKLLELAPAERRQTLLFSATMPGSILGLAHSVMTKPVHIRAEAPTEDQLHASTKQVVFQSHKLDKKAVIARILQAEGRGKTIMFARTKRSTALAAEDLAERGFAVAAVHGDLPQSARERSLAALRDGSCDVLVATDVAARGLDIDNVTHVINYEVPTDPQTYVHRIGRTGRAGKSGTAVTLVGYDELHAWRVIDEELGLGNPEPPRWFSNSPELYEALDIPEDADDRVGPARRVIGAKPPARRDRPRRGRGRR